MKSPKGILLVLAVVAATFLLAAPALASTQLNSYEKQLVNLVNKQRAKHHLPALRVNPKLVDASRAHSTEMGEDKYFDHNSADGELWSKRVIRYGYKRQGYSHWKAGEDIFWGANICSSPYVVMYGDDMKPGGKDKQVCGGMDSAAHRAVILTKAFRDIGVGAVSTDSGYGDVDGTVWFFTMDLGRRTQ
jgi:uncharacterized protein YkwD